MNIIKMTEVAAVETLPKLKVKPDVLEALRKVHAEAAAKEKDTHDKWSELQPNKGSQRLTKQRLQHLGVVDGEQRLKVWNSLLKDRQALAALVNQVTLNLDMRKDVSCPHELALVDYIVDK